MKRPIAFAVLIAAFADAGGAGHDSTANLRQLLSLPLEELVEQRVSIATQRPQDPATAPAVVSVITADDIRATGATNLVDVLQGVPGLYVRRSQFGFRPLIHFRGANDKQTLVMVNGAPVSDLMWRLGIFWKGLPASVIERVEIIRGPGSALYGTDASAGVINVITHPPASTAPGEAGLRVGSDDTQSAWLRHRIGWNGFDLAFSADLSNTDGHDPLIASDAQSRVDQLRATDASLAPGRAAYGYRNADLRLGLARDAWRIQLDYSRHDDLETGMTGAGAIDPVTEGRDSRFELGLFYDQPEFRHDLAVRAELRYRHIDYSSGDGFQEWPPGFDDGVGVYPDGVLNQMRSAENSVIAETALRYSGIPQHEITLGGGVRWQDIYRVEQWVNAGVDRNGNPLPPGGPLVDLSDSPYAFAPEKSRTVRYLFVQDQWGLAPDWELTAGLRLDNDSSYGNAVNPRLALVWQASDSLTAKLLYAQAFRAPYFQELYSETSFTLPNPDLEPEQSQTWELALTYSARADLRLGLNLFRFELDDVISPEPVPGLAKRRYQNGGRHRIHGIEMEAWWQLSDRVALSANYAYNDPDDSEHREYGVPGHQAYLRADWRFRPGWSWNLQGNWIGERERRANDARAALDDHVLVDTTLRYAPDRHWQLALSVHNLLDEDARDYTRGSIAGDLPLPGRSLFLEARRAFD
jgi:iron complex outermembrane receptor protein